MSRQTTHANMDFCVLNAQSVCVFACVNAKNTAYTTLSTLGGGVEHLSALAFSPMRDEGGDAMCQ